MVIDNTSASPLMWANPVLPEDTYNEQEAQALTATVQRTLPLHGCLRRAVAAGVTTALVALGQDWTEEARAHYPEIFSEVAAEPSPVKLA